MNANFSKKEIRHSLETVLLSEIEKIEGTQSSTKIKRVIRRVSKDIALKVKLEMKKNLKKTRKFLTPDTTNGYLIETNGHVDHDRP